MAHITRNTLWLGIVAVGLVGCSKRDDAGQQAPPPAPPAAEQPAPPKQPEAPQPKTIRVEDGFQTPESVLYDEDADVYLVSNINGQPLEADGNGYISKVSPDGSVLEEKWIDGAADGVTLHAPKGMALWNGRLYVTDIDTVRIFDPESGAPQGEIKVKGATFLNDLAAADDALYLSDTGMKAGAGGFEPSGSEAIYRIDAKNKPTRLASGASLNKPNGLWPAQAGGVWVVTFGANELYRITPQGKKVDVQTLPAGSLDGLVVDGDTFYISSWDASAVYRGPKTGPFEPVIGDVQSPADIGWDSKRQRILIPVFQGNAVHIEPLANRGSDREP